MRVTYFHYIYNSPGSLVQVDEFARAFRGLGHELTVHAMVPPPGPPQQQRAMELLKRPLAWSLHEANTLRKNLAHYQRECRIVQHERPDILLMRYKLYHASAGFVARRFHISHVVWIHAPESYEQRRYLKGFVQLPGLAEWIERAVLMMADKAIVVSEEVTRYLPSDPGQDGRIEVIPNGVDPEKFRPSVDGHSVRAQFPVPDPLVLGFVGVFAPWHGLEGLKAMVAWALKTFEQSCVLLVGDGPCRPEFEGWIRQGGWDPRRVQLTGFLPHSQVPAHVAATDICLLPYDQRGEGFYFSPLKLFEYLACGKPVLAARIGQVERVIRDGENGLLYSAGASEEAIAKLKRLMTDALLRRRLGEAARRTVLEGYTWAHTARKVEQVFEQVLTAHQGRR